MNMTYGVALIDLVLVEGGDHLSARCPTPKIALLRNEGDGERGRVGRLALASGGKGKQCES